MSLSREGLKLMTYETFITQDNEERVAGDNGRRWERLEWKESRGEQK